MRLTPFEIEAIKSETEKIFKNANVYLFGSRTINEKRGGDIDLLIETDKKYKISDKILFLVNLKNKIGEQKVDVVLYNKNQEKKTFVVQQAIQTGILL